MSDFLLDPLTHKPAFSGGVLALGNFDGVHRGHRAVLQTAQRIAHEKGLPVQALSFFPHPYAFFKKTSAPFLLTTEKAKESFLKEAGADAVLTLAFTQELASLTPKTFVEAVLINGLGVKHVVVGFDFVFGHDRSGDQGFLGFALAARGIGVTIVPPFKDEEGIVISSSRIRQLLKDGDIEKATRLLGRPFMIEGEIRHGDKRGRTLGYPTANMEMGDLVRPRYGVYIVQARRQNECAWRPAMANLGVRPSVDGQRELLEFNLFDFNADLYGESWQVALLSFLRPEATFHSLPELKEHIQKDELAARNYFRQKGAA